MTHWFKTTLVLICVLLLLPMVASGAENAEVRDLTKAFEVWKNQGIKFAIRENGTLVGWGTVKLESWGGESQWVVRNAKGHFLTYGNKYAKGKVEAWKNGKTKLVIRDSKGHLITHIPINLTSQSSFAANVVGLRRLKDSKFVAFVQESVAEIVIAEIKANQLSKAKALVSYLRKYHTQPGIDNFKPVLRMIQRQVSFSEAHGGGPEYKALGEDLKDVAKLL